MKRYNLKSGNILEVIQDDDAESPDIWGNTDMFLVYDHNQFSVKRKGLPSCVSSKFPLGKGGAPMPYCMFFRGGYAIHGSPRIIDKKFEYVNRYNQKNCKSF